MNCQSTLQDQVLWISLHRIEKHNAFNEALLDELQTMIQLGIANSEVKVIVLCAKGRFFSAGADLISMKTIAQAPLEENIAQAKQLADVLFLWHQCPKPTLCLIQGSAFGGALGFIAASDYSIGVEDAEFCFSEAKLGLIPAVISPYILETMGKRATKRFFMSAEKFSAHTAQQYQLLDEVVPFNALLTRAQNILTHWLQLPSDTLSMIKFWLEDISHHPIEEPLALYCAQKLAEVRMSSTAQHLLELFLSTRKA